MSAVEMFGPSPEAAVFHSACVLAEEVGAIAVRCCIISM